MTLKVNEIFYSIQGESSHAGRPCVFIRLAGCNLRCSYCDTVYAYEQGTGRTIADILESVQKYGCPLVEVTGGEPLLQEETPSLVQALLDAGYQVLLETNGSLDITRVSQGCIRIVDVKCPSSGMAETANLTNLEVLTDQDELKFVIGDREDFTFACTVVSRINRCGLTHGPLLFAPVSGVLAASDLAAWILESGLPVRLQLQLHKILWPRKKRGV